MPVTHHTENHPEMLRRLRARQSQSPGGAAGARQSCRAAELPSLHGNAGLGPFKPVVRFQKLSAMACSACKFHICSGECWQVLHAMYKGEYGLLPLVDDEQGAPCDADEEEEADEDEESDDDDM